MTGWPKVQLSQLGAGGRAFAMGPFGSRIKTENFRSSGVPVLRGKNLGGNRFDDSDVVFVDQAKAEELAASIARPGDLVFTHRGTLGQVALVPRRPRYPLYLVSQSQMKATFDEERVLPEYVYYWFCSPEGQHALLRNTSQTGVPAISQPLTSLQAIAIPLPPLAEQRAIAEVLGALDDKMEANRRVARSLEQRLSVMFLQFGFDEVGDAGDDGVALREIIEVNPPRKKIPLEVAPYIDMAALPMDSALVATPAFRKPQSGTRFVNSDTLMARITPCLENGKVAFVDCLASTEVGIGSTEFLVLRPREPLPAQFAYFLARSERFSTYAVQHMSGSSGRQRCPAEAIERYNIARPGMTDLGVFRELAGPAFAMMRATVNESVVLADLRDTLLPKLLSGELRVRDAERLVGEAV